MDKNFKEQLEQYSVAVERLMINIDLAAYMVGNVACGNKADNEEYLCRVEALMDSIVELAHKRNDECDKLIELFCKG